jgi:hypothetical protein
MEYFNLKEFGARTMKCCVDEDVINKLAKLNKLTRYKIVPFEDRHVNIFIFGLPRSGTTLLSQLLAKYTDLGYINNLTARFWVNPAFGVILSKSLNLYQRDKILLASEHGVTDSIYNVHEFGYFWASLLGHKSSSSSLGENGKVKINFNLLRNKVLSINNEFCSGCVFKNTLIGHYASKFNELFKQPLFVYIKRDIIKVATSVLAVRKERYGDFNHWWSTKPYEYEKIKNFEHYEQVVAQLFYLNRDIEQQLQLLPRNRILTVNYEELCEAPDVFLKHLKEKVEQYDMSLNCRCILEVLESQSKVSSLGGRDFKILEGLIKKYFGVVNDV